PGSVLAAFRGQGAEKRVGGGGRGRRAASSPSPRALLERGPAVLVAVHRRLRGPLDARRARAARRGAGSLRRRRRRRTAGRPARPAARRPGGPRDLPTGQATRAAAIAAAHTRARSSSSITYGGIV